MHQRREVGVIFPELVTEPFLVFVFVLGFEGEVGRKRERAEGVEGVSAGLVRFFLPVAFCAFLRF
jgi:hypothetical protein